MKLVSINANTEYCKENFIRSLRETIEDMENGKVQIGFAAIMDMEGEYKWAEFSPTPGPMILRLIGFLEYLKHVFMERLHG